MMSPKEALAKDGYPVKLGRGRLSREADARCRELAAQGWDIKGYAVDKSAPKSATAPVVVKKAPLNNEKVIADFTYVYDENAYIAKGEDGKSYGMREVCNICRVSLVQNHCDNPTILGGIGVTITPR